MIEELYAELSDLLKRPLKGHEKLDQPEPDDPLCTQLRGKCVAGGMRGSSNPLNLERETRLELATAR